ANGLATAEGSSADPRDYGPPGRRGLSANDNHLCSTQLLRVMNWQGLWVLLGPDVLASRTGGCVSDGDQAWYTHPSPARQCRAGADWRRGLRNAGAACDAAVWVCALLAAAWLSHGLAGATVPAAWPATLLAACLVPPAAGWLAGLYQGRFQLGSFEEVIRVGAAGAATALCLLLVGTFGVHGGRAGLGMVVAATGFALPALLGVRHAAGALRQRPAAAPPAAIKIIIFGAGSAGTQLVQRLAGGDSGYRPVALLD